MRILSLMNFSISHGSVMAATSMDTRLGNTSTSVFLQNAAKLKRRTLYTISIDQLALAFQVFQLGNMCLVGFFFSFGFVHFKHGIV